METGKLQEHNADDLLTQMSNVIYVTIEYNGDHEQAINFIADKDFVFDEIKIGKPVLGAVGSGFDICVIMYQLFTQDQRQGKNAAFHGSYLLCMGGGPVRMGCPGPP